MPVQEFECQIARGQIGRYLNGEGLSSEGLRHLGVHVAECAGCKKFLDQRKATLQGMLGEAPMPDHESMQAVVGVNPSEALIAQIRARTGEGEPDPEPTAVAHKPKPIITKPITYCGALALVLVGMTYMSHNMTGFLGQNAAQAIAANAPKTSTPTEVAKPASEAPKPPETKTPADPAVTTKAPDATAPATTAPAVTPATDDKKTPAAEGTPSAERPAETTPPAATDKTADAKSPSDTDAARPGIEPTVAKTTSPISINPNAPKPTSPKAAARPVAKPKAKVARWHRKWHAHRKGGLYNLKPGSAAIHVYSNPN